MNGLYVFVGGVIGLFVGTMGRNPALGLATGLVIGWLFSRTERLQRQIDELTAKIRAMRTRPVSTIQTEPEPEMPARQEAASAPEATPDASVSPGKSPWQAGDFEPSIPEEELPPAIPPLPREPSPVDRALTAAKHWITTGNIPAKVGVLVSFIGVSFLLKYAVDRNLFNLPIEFRLLGVALAGLVMMALGWRFRTRRRVYALSLQGGGAGVLFLTVYAALRIWQLLPEVTAFALLFVLAAVTGFLAVLQNSRTLALFGIVGGFLAPVLTSTGQGSHVALFSYYLVINLVILGIAWFRAWRVLNLVGFVFTFIISCFWGYRYFRPELFASTEPFLVLFFLFYQAVAILYALRQPPEKLGVVDGTLVFGTPVIAFGLQNTLVYGSEYGLAISAAVLSVFYAVCAAGLRWRKGAYLQLLTESFFALAVVFGTVAIPLAFDARWTSAAWALEGAALVWVGVRQGRHLANLAGFVLLLLAGVMFGAHGWRDDTGYTVLNGNVLGGLMVSLAALFSSRCLDGARRDASLEVPYRFAATIAFVWGVLWWLGTGSAEIFDRVPAIRVLPVQLLFVAASAVAAALVGRLRDWHRMRIAPAFFLPLLLLFTAWGAAEDGHFLFGLGWVAWPAALAAQLYLLREMDLRHAPLAPGWHVFTLFLLTAMLSIELYWRVDQVASPAWALSAAIASAGLFALLVWLFRHRSYWPEPAHPPEYLSASLLLAALQSLSLAAASLAVPGNADPLSYLPVLNPFGLGMLFAALTAILAVRTAVRSQCYAAGQLAALRTLFAAAFFCMTTAAVVRAIHQFTQVPWRFDALFESVIVQTSLSVYWGLLGFGGMVAGARTARRRVWIAGAGLMGLVVVKLFLVDLGNSGTVERIVSFIGTGVLLLVVGYFAPVPPKKDPQ